MKKYIALLPVLFVWVIAKAQVSGKVTDPSGEPLIGVSISIKGTTEGAITDLDGRYSIAANAGVLLFSYVGYESHEESIAGRSRIDVVLNPQAVALEGVVVIGYGAQRKKDLTGAVTVVDEKAISNRPMISAAEALQGKAAGVQVVQPSGKPGANLAVRVRGSTSVLAGNEPLYVVDGVPTTDIRGLNPADIETMSVLKDASSSSIYGARAANG
ncbi:MAG: TonB-dependent receptor plug domain-containing protein, partial [Haliscomenobacter sp.]